MKLLFEIDKKDYDPNGKVSSRPSARAIIFKNDKLAAIYSRKNKFYKIPGGGIEAGEENVEALIREVREEVGLVVIPETIREYGYVHRISKGRYEPIFIQDNFYYFCEVEDKQYAPQLSPREKLEGFVPQFVELSEMIRVNEEYINANPNDVMVERELRVLKMVEDSYVK